MCVCARACACVRACACYRARARVLTLEYNWTVCQQVLVDVTETETIIFSKEFKEVWAGGLAEESAAVLADSDRLRKGGIHSQLNWAILLCDVIPDGKTELTAQFWRQWRRPQNCPVVFHTENCAVHSGNPTVSSVYLPTPRWHRLKAHPFLAVHSADEHRMICSFSNTTSYSTFYAFFSSFRITLWPMWLANSKRQPCFYSP
jgi:hypothetical protein